MEIPGFQTYQSWAPRTQFSVSVQPITAGRKDEFVYGSFVRGDMIDKGYI